MIKNIPGAILALIAAICAFSLCHWLCAEFIEITKKRGVYISLSEFIGLVWIFPAIIAAICGLFIFWIAEQFK